MKKSKKYYALYKGDEILTIGTFKELAEYLGVTVSAVRCYHSPAHIKRCKSTKYLVIEIEEDD